MTKITVENIEEKLNFKSNKNFNNVSKKALNDLETFIISLHEALEKYEEYFKNKQKRQYYYNLQKKYIYFCYKEYPEMIAKINCALNQLYAIKKEEMSKNPCYDHVEIFNLLNDQTYTHFYNVVDYLDQLNIEDSNKGRLEKRIESITNDDSLSLQQINYLIDDLKFHKNLLEQKRNMEHSQYRKTTDILESLKTDSNNIFLSTPKMQDEDYDNKKNIYEQKNPWGKIISNINELQSKESLALIFAFCAQTNLFDVTYQDKISKKIEKQFVNYYTPNAYKSYIRNWLNGLKNYLFHLGGVQ
jgi:hypothetical protein